MALVKKATITANQLFSLVLFQKGHVVAIKGLLRKKVLLPSGPKIRSANSLQPGVITDDI